MKYWLIVADIDRMSRWFVHNLEPMYNLQDNSFFSSALTGQSQYEYVSFQGFVELFFVNDGQIGDDSIAGGAIDVVNITIKYDAFSSSSIRAFVSEYPRPVEIRPKQLLFFLISIVVCRKWIICWLRRWTEMIRYSAIAAVVMCMQSLTMLRRLLLTSPLTSMLIVIQCIWNPTKQ